MLELIIGNKNYSSWSMRAWMLLRLVGADFREIGIELYRPGARDEVRGFGGETGLVPVLRSDGHAIWDTMAIVEFLHERFPGVWPADSYQRARARSYAGEIHSGLNAVRNAMPCNTRARHRHTQRTPEVEEEIERVATIWAQAGDTWLFDEYSAVDVLFSPVAARFRTYDVHLIGAANDYCQRLLSHPLAREWFALGEAETGVIEIFELPMMRE